MSGGLLEATKLGIPYMQSPVDDLWSFYYVAQWAAAFNPTHFPADTTVPAKLLNLHCLIAGSESDRALGTLTITGPALDRDEYGQFLSECYPILSQWRSELNQLTTDWKAAKVDSLTDGGIYQARYPYFRSFTNRGVLELLRLLQQYFPNGFSGLN
jgi:hypothetical protein